MINSLKNMIAQVVYAPVAAKSTTPAVTNNPFSSNPFIQQPAARSTYAVNRPVKGGYFAGYYNGKQNIVGRRLFVEV